MNRYKEENLWISSLGGSGENGRNCHMIGWKDGGILLDCGVLRETDGAVVGGYPALTEELASCVQAVFLSHCHEDHAAALPLLYRLGYCGAVYASPETIREVPGFIRKWMTYVREHGGVLPYDERDCEKIRFVPISAGEHLIDNISILAGRSGHTCGSLWFRLTIGSKRILYTGDICMEPIVLAVDPLPVCDALIADCAYSGKRIHGSERLEELKYTVNEIRKCGGSVLLPVPAKGRGTDLLFLLGTADVRGPIWADASVAKSLRELVNADAWLRDMPAMPMYHILPVEEEECRDLVCRGGVFLVTDGMLSSESARRWLDYIRDNEKNCIVVTGHAAKGTPAADIFHSDYCSQNGILAKVKKITVKVHPDEDDFCRMAEQSGASKILMFHGSDPLTDQTNEWLKNRGITLCTRHEPVRMKI